MKISKSAIFFAGMFVGHFIISPIKDGRAKRLYDKLTDSEVNFKNYHQKSNKFNYNSDTYRDDKDYSFDNEVSVYSKANINNRSNQMNSNNNAYWRSRGYNERPDNWQNTGGNSGYSKAELDNHANQMNPNNEAYHSSRGNK